MAVYRMKRKGQAKAPEAKIPKSTGVPAAQPASDSAPGISRTRNRSLDAYVGSGREAVKSKEKLSMVEDVYNKRQKAAVDSINETDRMLLEAFTDDKQSRKEQKRREKERKNEEKRLRKLMKKNGSDADRDDRDDLLMGDSYADSLALLDNDEDSAFDPFEALYSNDELKAAQRPDADNPKEVPAPADDAEEVPAATQETAADGQIQPEAPVEEPSADEEKESASPEEPVRGSESEPAAEIAPEGAEDTQTTAEDTQSTEIAAELQPDAGEGAAETESAGERSAAAADPATAETRKFEFTGLDSDAIKRILEQEGLSAIDPDAFDSAESKKEKDKPSQKDVPVSESSLYDDDEDEDLSSFRNRVKAPEEFTDPAMAEEMTEGLKNRSAGMLAGAIWSFLVMLASLYLSTACYTSIPHPAFLTPGKYGIVLILVDLQLLIISGIINRRCFKDGFLGLVKGKAGPDSITAVAMTVTAIYQISLLFTSVSDEKIMLFSAAGCLFGFLNGFYHYLTERANYRAFKVVSSKKTKLFARRLDKDSAEFEALKEHLPEDPDIFSVEKTEFVSGFGRRTREPSQASGAYNAALWIVLAVALIFGVYSLTGGFAQAIKSFTVVILFGLPACGIFAVGVPMAKTAKRCAACESAVVGASAVDEYSGASVISFNDTELFPPKKIRVTSIRTYGTGRIDRCILYAAMIFKRVGGPLSCVFADSISTAYPEIADDFEILENTGDGICAKIDGKEVFVGNKDYMLSYDFGYLNDDIDESFESSVGRIMYMAIGDSVAAKFYVRYAFNARFERAMRSLYKLGTCVSVRTCDPNIDDELIKCMMRRKSYPVGILKTSGASMDKPVEKTADSGLVCTSSIMNMLRAFIYCAKAKRLINVNILVKFLSLFVGVFAALAMCFFGRLNSITTLFVTVYQLLWVLAVIIPSAAD